MKRQSLDSSFTVSSAPSVGYGVDYEAECDERLEKRHSLPNGNVNGTGTSLIVRKEEEDSSSDLIDLTKRENNALGAIGDDHQLFTSRTAAPPPERPRRSNPPAPPQRTVTAVVPQKPEDVPEEPVEQVVEQVQQSQKVSVFSNDNVNNNSNKISNDTNSSNKVVKAKKGSSDVDKSVAELEKVKRKRELVPELLRFD